MNCVNFVRENAIKYVHTHIIIGGKIRFAIENIDEGGNTARLYHNIEFSAKQMSRAREIKYYLPGYIAELNPRLHMLRRTRSTTPENPIFIGRNEPLSNIVVTRRNARCGSPFRHLRWNF